MVDTLAPEQAKITQVQETNLEQKPANPFRSPTERPSTPLTDAINRAKVARGETGLKMEDILQIKTLEAENGVIAARQLQREHAEIQNSVTNLRGRLSEAELAKEAAIKLANTDELTELPNLRWLKRELERKIELAKASGEPLWFLEIDFDDFKNINTTYGQKGGDEALRAIRELDTRIDENEDIARIGGDEFGQLLVGKLTPEEMKIIVARHVNNMRKASAKVLAGLTPLPEKQPLKEFALCIGIAPYQDGDDFDELKHRADLGLKEAKKDPDKGTGYLITMENGTPVPVPLKFDKTT